MLQKSRCIDQTGVVNGFFFLCVLSLAGVATAASLRPLGKH